MRVIRLSVYTILSIVHHLSGRNRHALTQIPPRRGMGRSTMCPRPGGPGLSPRQWSSFIRADFLITAQIVMTVFRIINFYF